MQERIHTIAKTKLADEIAAIVATLPARLVDKALAPPTIDNFLEVTSGPVHTYSRHTSRFWYQSDIDRADANVLNELQVNPRLRAVYGVLKAEGYEPEGLVTDFGGRRAIIRVPVPREEIQIAELRALVKTRVDQLRGGDAMPVEYEI